MSKEPGSGGFGLRPVSLDLSFEEEFEMRYPDAYERLLMEVIRGNPALFMRRDESNRPGAGLTASLKAGPKSSRKWKATWQGPGGRRHLH